MSCVEERVNELMIRILVVDDELFVRERIKGCIDWESIGMKIVGETEDGIEGIQKLEELQPDIVITDISMPCMNGLEFSNFIRENYPKIKVVILTGYSDFDYAREAISAGVLHYLLKPVNKNEIMKIMLQLKEMIEQQQIIEDYVGDLKKDSREYYNKRRQEIFQIMVEHEDSRKDLILQAEFKKYFHKIKAEYRAVLVIEKSIVVEKHDSNPQKRDMISDKEESMLWIYAVTNVMNEIFEKYMETEILHENGQRGILLIGCTEQSIWNHYSWLVQKAARYIKKHLGIIITVGVSNLHYGLQEIALAYKEANIALKNKLILGEGQIIAYTDIQDTMGKIRIPVGIHTELLVCMRLNNFKAVQEKIKDIFEEIKKEKMSVDNIYIILAEVMLVLTEYAKEKNLEAFSNVEVSHFVQNIMDNHHSLEDIETEILGQFRVLLASNEEMGQQGYTSIMRKAKKYIDEHYQNQDMKLEVIANHAGISPCYLSNLFKKESKISLNDYITRKRMQRTKELLEQGGCTLAEITERVGFADPYYLSKCFKKIYGVSPTRYKR